MYASRNTFGNQSIGDTSSDSLTTEGRLPLMSRRRTAVVEEVDVLSFDAHILTLARMLMAVDGNQMRAVALIRGMGGLVLTKRQSVEEWRSLLKCANWQRRQGEEHISEILALSYLCLPYHMKPCFLYISIFPNGSLSVLRDLCDG